MTQPLKLFVSYRRADSRKDAGRLYDRLAQTFGKENVFKDVDNINPGADFRGAITEAVSTCDVVLAVIGPNWLNITDEHGNRRLDNPGDFVRLELETGLARDRALVIPVLVDGASMPNADDLPVSLRELAFKHAVVVRDDPDFHHDVTRLINNLQARYPGRAQPSPSPSPTAARDTFNVREAITAFYKACDQRDWERARELLAAIRDSGKAPRVFDVQEAEKSLWQLIEQDEAEQEYDILRVMAKRESPARVWAALQRFWEKYPDYDPDGIADQVRPKPPPPPPPVSPPPKPKALRVEDILPSPFEWCPIPAGSVTLEDASDRDPPGTKGGRSDEIPAFAIAKYPITNAQYQVFVDAPDGYRDPRWWDYSSEAKAWREANPTPKATAFAGDDLPRTNVNWYDSVAFCRWLSHKTGQNITLPTEQQWQRAAQGDTGWDYPWGPKFDKSRCNFNTKGTTPVTQYQNGASPYQVMDMSGNVWEWCLTEWGTDSVDMTGSNMRVLRGGSWGYGPRDDLRVGYRDGDFPGDGNVGRGFRPARS